MRQALFISAQPDKSEFIYTNLLKPLIFLDFPQVCYNIMLHFPLFLPIKPKRGQRLIIQASPFESEIHPLHNSVDLCRGHFVHTLEEMDAEAKRRNDARRQQARTCSRDYDRGR